MTGRIEVSQVNIGQDEIDAVTRVMRSGNLAQGPEVAAFEVEFARALTPGRAVSAVNSGTSALHLMLLAAGVGPGMEVIVPSFTFAASANAVALTGATPVFADIDEATYGLDPAAVEACLTPRTAAIMPVHLYGHPADMTHLGRIATRHQIALFEDAAQAHGATWNGQQVGTFGLAAAFSLYPTKNMTSGEGGMVATDDPDLDRTVRLLRNQGMLKRYENEIVGFNNRMSDLHAAIGRVQLSRVMDMTAKRKANAAFLTAHLAGVITPTCDPRAGHVYHQYTVRLVGLDRDRFAAELDKRGIGCGVYYPTPVHRLPSFAAANASTDLPVTEQVARTCLSLPVHPGLSDADLTRIVETVNALARAGA